MTEFTPISALIGGAIIGLSASCLYLFCGKIAGVSGMFHSLFPPKSQPWQIMFLIGLLIGGLAYYLIPMVQFPLRQAYPLKVILLGGFLVGFGTRLGSGCTSGHGVCGIARLSLRSIIATVLFLLAAILTATFTKGLLI